MMMMECIFVMFDVYAFLLFFTLCVCVNVEDRIFNENKQTHKHNGKKHANSCMDSKWKQTNKQTKKRMKKNQNMMTSNSSRVVNVSHV